MSRNEISQLAKKILSSIPHDVWLSQEEIANIAGIPRKKVKYVLRDLKKHGILQIKRDIMDLRKKKYRIVGKIAQGFIMSSSVNNSI